MLDFEPVLSEEWINRLQSFKHLIVGFSGGIDSTVLLHLLATQPSLHSRIHAVHVNHGISANAIDWQKHCELFCHHLNISFTSQTVEFNRSANIEERARKARFAVFSNLLTTESCLLLGHHLEDQAETLLLQLVRGTGVDGLAGMQELNLLSTGCIARPLLTYSRLKIHSYARIHNLLWIEDESNLSINYSRNFLRHKIMPLLIEKWPGVVGNLARTAAHCQQAQANLYELAIKDCNELKTAGNSLYIGALKALSVERIINVLRVWLKRNKVQLPTSIIFKRLIYEVIRASAGTMPLVSWNDVGIRRYKDYIYIVRKTPLQYLKPQQWLNFPASHVLANGYNLSVTAAKEGLHIPEQAQLTIRFREGGGTNVSPWPN